MRSVGLVVPDVLALWCGGDTEAFVGRPTVVVPEVAASSTRSIDIAGRTGVRGIRVQSPW